MFRTTFVISSMRCGGSERVVSHMANYWARKNWPITVLTICHGSGGPCYQMDSRVVHRDMRFTRASRHALPDAMALRALKQTFDECTVPERRILLRQLDLIGTLRRAITATRPEVVISFIDATNVRVLLAAHGLNVPVIVSERTDPYRNVLSEGMTRLRRRVYPKAAYLVAQTDDMAAYFSDHVGERVRIIHNPVLLPAIARPIDAAREAPKPARVLVGMGRLVEEKGFILLLHAFSRIIDRHPSWTLEIWGSGPQRPALERAAGTLCLNGRVRLPGFASEPAMAFSGGDLFVLPSLSEGFPNVLCEAMACGLPAVTFNCSSGVRTIVRNGIDGLIVRSADVAALAGALDRLMSSEEERARFSMRAVEVIDRFAIEKTMALWEQLAHESTRGARAPARPGIVTSHDGPGARHPDQRQLAVRQQIAVRGL